MRGRRARERIDRLIVIPHDTELVSVSEPQPQQRLLERVDVLVLVDGDRVDPVADRLRGSRRPVEEPDRQAEHVFEVEPTGPLLAALVPLVYPEHQLGGDRRVMRRLLELVHVPRGVDHAVLGPLDLARELFPRDESVRSRQGVRERRDQRRLRSQHLWKRLSGLGGPPTRQLRQRRGVERAGLDALHPQALEPCLELRRSLLGERDGEDVPGRERPGRNLVRDPVRDGRRFARAGPGEDRDRATDRGHRLTLPVVQRRQEPFARAHARDVTSGPSDLIRDVPPYPGRHGIGDHHR